MSRLRNHFVENFSVVRAETAASGPHTIVTEGTAVRVTIKIRIVIASCIVCDVNIMSTTKSWTIVIVTVCGISRVAVHVYFKGGIPGVVLQ